MASNFSGLFESLQRLASVLDNSDITNLSLENYSANETSDSDNAEIISKLLTFSKEISVIKVNAEKLKADIFDANTELKEEIRYCDEIYKNELSLYEKVEAYLSQYGYDTSENCQLGSGNLEQLDQEVDVAYISESEVSIKSDSAANMEIVGNDVIENISTTPKPPREEDFDIKSSCVARCLLPRTSEPPPPQCNWTEDKQLDSRELVKPVEELLASEIRESTEKRFISECEIPRKSVASEDNKNSKVSYVTTVAEPPREEDFNIEVDYVDNYWSSSVDGQLPSLCSRVAEQIRFDSEIGCSLNSPDGPVTPECTAAKLVDEPAITTEVNMGIENSKFFPTPDMVLKTPPFMESPKTPLSTFNM